MKNIILIGLGPHARGAYYPILERYQKEFDIHIPLIIDLESQRKEITNFLKGKFLHPEETVFLKADENNILGKKLDPKAKFALDKTANNNKIDGVFIITEPKAHKIYIEWALNRGIDILTEKPLTSPIGACTNIKAAKQVYEDYIDIMKIAKRTGSDCYTMIQKRNGQAYVDIYNYLDKFIKEYQVPLTYFEDYFADGTWPMPTELEKENHPYKYGYGKLFHSGYHYVDLAVWITSLNNLIKNKKADKIRLYVNQFRIADFLFQLNAKEYRRLFKKTSKIDKFFSTYRRNRYADYGEMDVYVLLQMLCNDIVINTTSVTLQQNSFSRRSWLDYPTDPYKSYGRLRHERLNMQVSNLLNIQLHSYQSYDNRHNHEETNLEYIGQKEHQEVYIFRNADVIGGKPFEKINYGEMLRKELQQGKNYVGHNDKGKDSTIFNFLRKKRDNTQLEDQELSMKIFSKICEAMALQQKKEIPYLEFDI